MFRLIALLALALALAVAALAVYVARGGEPWATFRTLVLAHRAHAAPGALVTEADLAELPPAVARYLRLAGAVGRPRPAEYRARFRGRIRSGPDAPWMPVSVEQVSFTDPPARFFFLRASMFGVPVLGLHHMEGAHARMRILVAGLVPIVDAAGARMDRSETVTLLNDLAVLAPAGLLSPAITWREVSPDTVEATCTNGEHVVRAKLVFAPSGELVDFVSDDRWRASSDGRTFTRERWSTPLGTYRAFGARRLAGRGAGRWHPTGAAPFDYLQLEMTDLGEDADSTAAILAAPR
ncbi:MAG: DUF6544 family protein [Candidatus Eisenbacteria bacterium]